MFKYYGVYWSKRVMKKVFWVIDIIWVSISQQESEGRREDQQRSPEKNVVIRVTICDVSYTACSKGRINYCIKYFFIWVTPLFLYQILQKKYTSSYLLSDAIRSHSGKSVHGRRQLCRMRTSILQPLNPFLPAAERYLPFAVLQIYFSHRDSSFHLNGFFLNGMVHGML